MSTTQFTATPATIKAGSFYFLYYAAAAALMPFLVILYEQLDLSGRQIGFLIGISPLISWLSAPLWGGVADAKKQHKRLLLLAISGAIAVVVTLSFTTQFLTLIPIIILFSFFTAPIVPLVDSSVMTLLGAHKDQYGKLRMWGAVGWGIMAPLVGILSDRSGLQWIFWGYLAGMILALFVAVKLPIHERTDQPYFGREVRQLLTDRRWLFFLAVVFMAGVGMAMIASYLFLYIQSLGGNKSLMGLALAIATLSEIPLYFYADRLLGRWGAKNLLMFSLAMYVIRAFLLSLIQVPWLVLPLQLFHGATFAVMWVAGVSYADKLAPPDLGATAQGLFTGVLMGLGSAVGGFIGGIAFATIGGAMMYRWTSGIILLALGLFFIADKRNLSTQKI